MKIIAISGSSGFLGRQVVNALLAEDCSIRLIIRNVAQLPATIDSSKVELVDTHDLFSEPNIKLRKFFKNVDTFIHAAWYAEHGKYLTSEFNMDCLSGTMRLAQAFADGGGRRFVGIGTCFEYDVDQGVLRTDSPLKPLTLYAACKLSCYHVLSHFFAITGVEFVWCRVFYLYGDGEDERRLVSYIKRQLSAGKPAQLTSGKQIRDFLDVQEAGRMIAESALGSQQGPLNICSGVPITVKELAERIADEYGRRDLLQFGARPDNLVDPPCVVGVRDE